MKILKKNDFCSVFPMEIKCERILDKYGLSYGEPKDFCGSELEISAEDIKRHDWFKYPDCEGIDYGVICPVCKRFIVIQTDKIPNVILENAESIKLNLFL